MPLHAGFLLTCLTKSVKYSTLYALILSRRSDRSLKIMRVFAEGKGIRGCAFSVYERPQSFSPEPVRDFQSEAFQYGGRDIDMLDHGVDLLARSGVAEVLKDERDLGCCVEKLSVPAVHTVIDQIFPVVRCEDDLSVIVQILCFHFSEEMSKLAVDISQCRFIETGKIRNWVGFLRYRALCKWCEEVLFFELIE